MRRGRFITLLPEALNVRRFFRMTATGVISFIELLRDALKKINISLEKLIAIVMGNDLSPLCGIADPSRAYS